MSPAADGRWDLIACESLLSAQEEKAGIKKWMQSERLVTWVPLIGISDDTNKTRVSDRISFHSASGTNSSVYFQSCVPVCVYGQ